METCDDDGGCCVVVSCLKLRVHDVVNLSQNTYMYTYVRIFSLFSMSFVKSCENLYRIV